MAVWYSLCSFGIFLVCLVQEKSGNPTTHVSNRQRRKVAKNGSVATCFLRFHVFERKFGLFFQSSKKNFEAFLKVTKAGCQMAYFQTKKNPIWVNFGGSCNGKCWYIICPFGQFYNHLVYFSNMYAVASWYILWSSAIFSPVLVCCTKKNLANLHERTSKKDKVWPKRH
jgi:hypothetical protein